MRNKTVKTFDFADGASFDAALYKKEMSEHGVFLAQFGSEIDFLSVIESVGRPHSHNGDGAYVWDIKPQPGKSSDMVARSQTMEEFVFHTDCSFEVPPPTFVALYVVHEDRMGGGISKLIDFEDILGRLDPSTRELLAQDFKVKIPKEFMKGETHSRGPILFGGNRIAYRRECIVESELSTDKVRALDELDRHIADPSLAISLLLPRNSILFLDNTRFLHARTEIKDDQRHLQRVRYF